MALALQVVSSHLLRVRDITDALSGQPALVDRMLPYAVSEALFLLEDCSLAAPLGALSGRLRRDSPGSKFLALLAPQRNDIDEMTPVVSFGASMV